MDDPGSTQYDGEPERTYTLALARATRTALLRGWDCAVQLTHEGPGMVPGNDLDAELEARGELPNALGADFFMSLHHNAGAAEARGAELYIWTSKRAPDGGLVWLPAIDPATGAPNHNAPRSYAMAQVMQPVIRDLLGQFAIPWRGAPDRIMCADFAVLRYPNLPCMLLESHFGTNPDDDAAADRPEFVPMLAATIARAIALALQLPALETGLIADVILPRRPGEAYPRVIRGEVRNGVTYATLPGTANEQAVRPVAEAMARSVRWFANPPTVLIE